MPKAPHIQFVRMGGSKHLVLTRSNSVYFESEKLAHAFHENAAPATGSNAGFGI